MAMVVCLSCSTAIPTWSQNDERQPCIIIESKTTKRLGSVLPAERRAWMAAVLRKLLMP